MNDEQNFQTELSSRTKQQKFISVYNPIAIVGMGCRFPGNVNSPKEFWKLLIDGTDAITDVPSDRWNQDYFYAKDRVQAGSMICPQGGFLKNIKEFDYAFFGISSNEANSIDPQQRIALQVAWEAFEQGGIDIAEWKGRSVGVFMGCFTADYQNIQFLDQMGYSVYSTTGMMNTMLSNRLSFTFDFKGPSMSIDTACSASLTALHQACISLQRNRSEIFQNSFIHYQNTSIFHFLNLKPSKKSSINQPQK